jgi:hypothetical protein
MSSLKVPVEMIVLAVVVVFFFFFIKNELIIGSKNDHPLEDDENDH